MKNPEFKHKILLAVDPEDEKIHPVKSVWKALDRWAGHTNSRIEVIHVLQYPQRMMSDDRFVERIQLSLKKFVTHSGMKNCQSYKIITGTTSIKKSVSKLLKYVHDSNAKAIALISHGRKWFSRMIMGSFSETLIMESTVPVIFLSRKSISGNDRVLFLTDFTKASTTSFQIFLDEFSGMASELVLYHALEPTYEFVEISNYSFETRKYAVEQMEKLSKLANGYGIKNRWIIEDNVLDIAKAVMKIVNREKIPMIGLSSSATRYGMIFIGSVAKRLFRIDKVTCWVCGPEAIKKGIKKRVDLRIQENPSTLRL